MRSRVVYEWDIETVDNEGDVVDHNHSNKCPTRKLRENEVLVLVRDLVSDTVEDRLWAYVKDGKLPERFTNAYGRPCERVPKRFHAEIQRMRPLTVG